MLNMYETKRGDFAPAYALTTAEAVDLHRRGILLAVDFPDLSAAARAAVATAFETKLNEAGPCTGTTVLRWGVRRPTRVHIGRT